MNIGIISYILNPKSGARAPIEIANGLAKNNKVTFYAVRYLLDEEAQNILKDRGVKVVLLDKSSAPRKLFRLLKKGEHDILSTHTTLPLMLAALISGTPVVNTYYGTQFNVLEERFLSLGITTFFINKTLNLVIFIISFLLVNLPKEVVGISKYTAEEADRLYKRKCSFVYLGNAPKHFKGQSKVTGSKKVNLLTVSRITPYKQFEKIISAANKLDGKVELTIAGSAPQPKYVSILKTLANANTKILTDISDKKLIELYRYCDIYMTADKYLFFGMPILEAASFGKPAIAYDYCAARELIQQGKTGYVAVDDKTFEKYLSRLVGSKKLRVKMGLSAKKKANGFSWEKTAKEYEKLFGKVLK